MFSICVFQLGPGHYIVTKRNFRLLAYRGRVTAAANCLQRIPLTDVDKKFMLKQQVRRPNLYDKEDCRDLEHMLRQWERKFMDRRADKLTDKYKVPKRDKTDDQAQHVAGDQAEAAGDQAQEAAGDQPQNVAGDQAQNVAGDQAQHVAGDEAEAAVDPTGAGQRDKVAAATGDKQKKKEQAKTEKAAAATGDKPKKGKAKKEKAAEASADPEQQESVKPKKQAGSCDCVMCD